MNFQPLYLRFVIRGRLLKQREPQHAIRAIGYARDRVIRVVACILMPLQVFIGAPLPVLFASPPSDRPELIQLPSEAVLPSDLAAQISSPWQAPAPVRSRPATTPRVSIDADRLAGIPDQDVQKDKTPGRALPSLAAGPVIKKAQKDKALQSALIELDTWRDREAFPAAEAYLAAHPATSQSAAIGVALGIARFEQGYFSRAVDLLKATWQATENSQDPDVYDLANEAGIRLAGLLGRVGRQAELQPLLASLNTRRVGGPLRERLQVANEAFASMQTLPQHAFKCGPLALLTLRDSWQLSADAVAGLRAVESTPAGFTLDAVNDMATTAGLNLTIAYRPKGAPMVDQAVVHWRADHYAAIVGKHGDKWIVRDPTFAQDFLMSAQAFDDEGSGYYLINGALPPGWRSVSKQEAQSVFGRGAPSGQGDEGCGDDKKCPGMAGYYIDDFLVSLQVTDTPLGYQPPVGPAIDFTFTYNQRGTFNLTGQNISHLGPQWTLNWLVYTEDADALGNQRLFAASGRIERYSLAQISAGVSHYISRYRLLGGTSGVPFERVSPDGTREVYGRVVTGTGPYPKRFLTKLIDRFGNQTTLSYDASNRLTAITDAVGQVSLFNYQDAADSYRITSISDPFSRVAQITYDTSGRLKSITDPENITSSFFYENATNPTYLTKLTTPYGDTRFDFAGVNTSDRVVEVIDPIGRKERVEYRHSYNGTLPGMEMDDQQQPLAPLVPIDPANPTAGNIDFDNEYLYYGNTLRWDHKTYVEFPPNPSSGANYNKAHSIKWLWSPDAGSTTIALRHSEKAPLENRLWYYYDGQNPGGFGTTRGPLGVPNVIARVLADGTTQATRYTFNAEQQATSMVDPKGRKTFYDRTANGYDLDKIRQYRSATATTETLADYDWTALRLPQTITDAALQATGLTFNTRGQISTITNARNETHTFIYDLTLDGTPDSYGYLIRVEGPLAGANTHLTYDSARRVRTVTDSEGYTLTYDYDDLDRLTLVTYPDATFDQFAYERLDLKATRDREGRWTRHWYDRIGQRLYTLDPANRSTQVDYCYCGAPKLLVDAEGNTTRWDYDIQGRLTKKTYPDLTTATYTYEATTSRLAYRTDALNQETHYTYDLDDALLTTTYVNALNPTPGVAYTYETDYPRLSTMVDGTGLTSITYHPVTAPTGTLGAARLHTVDGPLAGDTISYAYDQLGRSAGRSINGAANSQTLAYDQLGRLSSLGNLLGTFTPAYAGRSDRPTALSLPGGLTMAYGYGTAAQDFRLQSIALKNGGTTLSSHGYTHSPTGRITTWTQSFSGQPVRNWSYGYDRADQLTQAINTPSSGPAQTFGYGYDRIGNRVSETVDSSARTGAYNDLNQLQGWTGGGRVRVAGSLSEPATVSVAGAPAQRGPGNTFSADVDLPVGTSTVPIVATDGSNNTRTANYSITVASGATATYAYDAVGNLTAKVDSSGTVAYTWDAANRLIGIAYPGGASTQMSYDGFSRRVRIVEKNALGAITEERRFVYDGLALAERRAADGATVQRRYFAQGVQAEGNARLYFRDHLGSVNQLIDPASPATPTASYAYDPFGKRVKIAGSEESDAAYTGHYYHAASGLQLALYRAYDANTGRWLSRDPIAELGGLNLYQYVNNLPTSLFDPLGLVRWGQTFWGTVSITIGVVGLVGLAAVASPVLAVAGGVAAAVAVTGGLMNVISGVTEAGPTNLPSSPFAVAGYIADRIECPEASSNHVGNRQKTGQYGDYFLGGLRGAVAARNFIDKNMALSHVTAPVPLTMPPVRTVY